MAGVAFSSVYGEKLLQKAGIATAEKAGSFASNSLKPAGFKLTNYQIAQFSN
ncbi:hypothetical protein [Flavobacterium macacae]|uniref:hypothetical protein n=1 Tax=Flavobacterium macacae TaxID=2488993 RepID=UPI0013158D4F|nr:hypothetical protein [Flavobacterium macacae]